MATLSDRWAAEQAQHILRAQSPLDSWLRKGGTNPSESQVRERPEAPKAMRSASDRTSGLPHTKEQAADAIYYQLGGLIRDTADEHILDPIELRDAVWRKMTLDSAHSRAKKLDIFADIIHVLRAGE